MRTEVEAGIVSLDYMNVWPVRHYNSGRTVEDEDEVRSIMQPMSEEEFQISFRVGGFVVDISHEIMAFRRYLGLEIILPCVIM